MMSAAKAVAPGEVAPATRAVPFKIAAPIIAGQRPIVAVVARAAKPLWAVVGFAFGAAAALSLLVAEPAGDLVAGALEEAAVLAVAVILAALEAAALEAVVVARA